MRKIIFFTLLIFIFLFFSIIDKNYFQVTKIVKEENTKITVEIEKNNQRFLAVFHKDQFNQKINIGEKVIGEKINKHFIITDFYRSDKIFLLFLILLITLFFTLNKKALRSLFSLILTFFVIFFSILPNIIAGYNTLVTVIVSLFFLIPINYFIAHGYSKKTLSAVISSLILIFLSIIFSLFTVKWLNLTGLTEEANFINIISQTKINFQDLYIASIVLGVFGSIDDITINQSAIVETLIKEKINLKKIYQQSIKIGHDHINSIFNTLLIVYLSAGLPLYLLFYLSKKNYVEVLNYEIIAQEILRMLIATFITILSVPLTTYISLKLHQQR